MVTRGRQRCLGEKLGRDTELRKERTMQCTLDDDRDFGCLGELHDTVQLRRFSSGERQGAPKADQMTGAHSSRPASASLIQTGCPAFTSTCCQSCGTRRWCRTQHAKRADTWRSFSSG